MTIPINIKRLKRYRYPAYEKNSEPVIVLTDDHMVEVLFFNVIGYITIFKKGKLWFYINNLTGSCRFSRYYYTTWESLMTCKPIKVKYVKSDKQ